MESYNPLGIYEPSKVRATASPTPSSTRALAGGRVSVDKGDTGFEAAFTVLSPTAPEDEWRLAKLDSKTLSRISVTRLLELLTDLSPDISRALWDFLRMCNPGWEVKVTRPDSEQIYRKGQRGIEAFLSQLSNLYGAVDVVFGRLFFSAFMRGAFFAELVLDEAGMMPIDLATPDPCTARFRRVDAGTRGRLWELGQWQKGQFVNLNRPTISYVPVDPFPNKPYGRPLVSPALFTTLFLLGMLHDIRRVVAQQGYPRLHIQVNAEELMKTMPSSLSSDPAKTREWLQGAVDQVSEQYSKLEPDDAYVTTSVIDVQNPVGTIDARSIGGVANLIEALERMATRALKTMPLLMASSEGTSEANANRQWEIHVAGIKSLQHLAEQMLGRLFGLALQAQGISAEVMIQFAELRAAELMRDAQVERIRINNARAAYDNGYVSQDEAAMMAVGKEKADAPAPRASVADSNVDPMDDQNPEPGDNRNRELRLVGGASGV